MLYETTPGGNLRLFRPGDFTFQGRIRGANCPNPSPDERKFPSNICSLLDWYESWCKETHTPMRANQLGG